MAICASEKKLYLQKVTGIRRGRVYTVVKNEKRISSKQPLQKSYV